MKISLLILIGLIIYINSLTNGWVGDDKYQILNNLNVHKISNIPKFFSGSTYYNGGSDRLAGIYYRPIMMSAFALIYAFAGPDPFYFHLIQVVIHITNSVLVFYLFKKFFRPDLAYGLALIFLVHPQNNEAVVYIANLQDVLFVFFGLLGLLWSNYLMLFLSVLTKETGAIFLVMSSLRQKKLKWGYIGISLVYPMMRFGVANIGSSHYSVAPIAIATATERLMTIPSIIWFYVKTFVAPWKISALHYWVVKNPNFENFYFPLVMTVILFVSIWRLRIGFFLTWLILGLVVHLQIIEALDATAADRWFYMSSIAALGIIGTIISKLKREVSIFMILVILIFGIRTVIRNFDWKDTLTLYTHDIPMSDRNYLVDNAIATELIDREKFDEARPFIESSVASYPYFANLNNAAIIALAEGDIAGSRRYLEQALAKSDHYMIWENYVAFLRKYFPTEAEEATKKALRLYPNDEKFTVYQQ